MPLPLLSYQLDAARLMASRARFGLFDDMGLGKTATTIHALDLCGIKRGIVVCPAAVRDVWRGEHAKFAVVPRKIVKAKNIHDFVAWSRGKFDVLICSFEHMAKWAKLVAEKCVISEFLVIDEGHYLKNAESLRTQAILGKDQLTGLLTWCERCWWLTGTPMSNDPMDIYTFLRAMDVMPLLGPVFARRYFYVRPSTYGTKTTPRPDLVAELQALIYNNAIRRTQSQVNIQLPPIFLTSVELEGDTSQVLELLRNYPGLSDAIMAAVDQGSLSFLDAQHLMTLRRLVGEAKAVPYAHLLAQELADGGYQKRVVFAHHKSAISHVRNYLALKGIQSVTVDGGVSERQRIEAQRRFAEDPSCTVFFGNIRAAGTGLTLTSAANIDMLESDWAPAPNAQAIKRVHRLTQVRTVRARFITLADSLDVSVNAIVARKTAAIAAIEGDRMLSTPDDGAAQVA